MKEITKEVRELKEEIKKESVGAGRERDINSKNGR